MSSIDVIGRIIQIVFFLTLAVSVATAAEETTVSDSSVTDATSNRVVDQQCVIQRTRRALERELLTVPAEACTIRIRTWIIKADALFSPIDGGAFQRDAWWQTLWEDPSIPMMSGKNWSLSFQVRGITKGLAVVKIHY